jgi:hypothetical protein
MQKQSSPDAETILNVLHALRPLKRSAGITIEAGGGLGPLTLSPGPLSYFKKEAPGSPQKGPLSFVLKGTLAPLLK